jgi:NTE family protein
MEPLTKDVFQVCAWAVAILGGVVTIWKVFSEVQQNRSQRENQTVAVRKRQLVSALVAKQRLGAYRSIRSELANFKLPDALDFKQDYAHRLASTPTRLVALHDETQMGLINWGYAVADAAMRKHVVTNTAKPTRLPYV